MKYFAVNPKWNELVASGDAYIEYLLGDSSTGLVATKIIEKRATFEEIAAEIQSLDPDGFKKGQPEIALDLIRLVQAGLFIVVDATD